MKFIKQLGYKEITGDKTGQPVPLSPIPTINFCKTGHGRAK